MVLKDFAKASSTKHSPSGVYLSSVREQIDRGLALQKSPHLLQTLVSEVNKYLGYQSDGWFT